MKVSKNGDNVQLLTYTVNSNNPVFIPVKAALRIGNRVIRLGVPPEL